MWNYEHCDFMYAKLQATELVKWLRNVFENLPFFIVESQHSVQVRTKELKRDSFFRFLLENEFVKGSKSQRDFIDFILYIGFDNSVENNIKFLNRI